MTSLLGWLLAPLVLADWLIDRHSLAFYGVDEWAHPRGYFPLPEE